MATKLRLTALFLTAALAASLCACAPKEEAPPGGLLLRPPPSPPWPRSPSQNRNPSPPM